MQNRNRLAGCQSPNFSHSNVPCSRPFHNVFTVKQPDETHIVVYKQAETKTKDLNGRVACKLSAANYGASEWWLLLEPQA